METGGNLTNTVIGQQLHAIKTAANHASHAHKGQFRKERRTPYIIHPARVAPFIGIFGGTQGGIIAAWVA